MQNKMIITASAFFLAAGILSFSENAQAAVVLPWSTTYNCPDWNTYGDPLICDGLSKAGGWTDSEGHYEQITSAANYPGGDGGKGQKHWIGPGTNDNSGGISMTFNNPQSEIWMRWYMRWEQGFGDFHTFKVLYIYSPSLLGTVFHVGYPGIGGINLWSSVDHYYCQNCGWGNSFYTSGISDGTWQCFEIHMNTVSNIFQAWHNDQLIVDRNDVDYGSFNSVSDIMIGSNCKDVTNSQCMYVDYDDIAVSNTGYIGPLSSTCPNGVCDPGETCLADSCCNGVTYNTVTQICCSDVVYTGDCCSNADCTSPNTCVSNVCTAPSTECSDTIDNDGDGAVDLSDSGCADANDNDETNCGDGVCEGGEDVGTCPADCVGGSTIFFQEDFEDASFGSRGWYDNTGLQLSTTEHIPGSTSSVEYHFLNGATTPTSGGSTRHKFTDTDEVYVSYWVKYSSNWEGSNQVYHPHEFGILTNLDGDWVGPAYTYLTAYIEQNEGEPLFAIQDGQNIDESNIGVDLTSITENRSVAGCNGDSDGYGNGECYSVGSGHFNGKNWKAGSVYFQDTPGQYYKNDWHFIEAYFKLNSISGSVGVADGIIKYWYDGNPIINHNNVMMRTAQHPSVKFNQFIIAPYIGDGSPVDQTFWVDDLTVADYRVGGVTDLTPPSLSNPQPTGTLSSGTTSTTISLDTDETAECKYDTASGVTFDQQQFTFDTTGSTTHSTTVSGLSDGETKTYYIRCQDTATPPNQNPDDFEISFSIASSSTTYSISNFIQLVSDWLKSEPPTLESDVNGDGVVNTRDLGIMMSNWQ